MRLPIIQLLLIPFVSVVAESFFNPRGLGEEWGVVDARTFGLSALGPTNPAYGLRFSLPTFSLTTVAEFITGKENNRQRSIGGFVPLNFMGFVPLPLDFGLRVGLGERFCEDFSVYSDSTTVDFISYRKHIIGRGGVYGANFGAGKSFFKNFSVGADFTWLFGSSVEEWRVEVFNGDYLTKDTTRAVFSGYNFDMGFTYQSRLFTLNGFFKTPAKLTIVSEVRFGKNVESSERGLTLPTAFGMGLSINGPKRTGLFFDYLGEPWTGTNADLGFTNGASFALGLEFKDIPLTIGYKNRVWYVQSVNNKDINEHAVFLKSSRPISFWGDFNFGLEFLQRGDGSLTEMGLRLFTTLSFEEPWKRRQRRWGG